MSNVYLGLGSNLGDRSQYLSKAVEYLKNCQDIKLLNESSIYETKPYGYTNQPNFLNMVIHIQTKLEPLQLLRYIHQVEEKLGRKREIHWGPRTLDIDILLYDDKIIKSELLEIPHKEMSKRLFVLIPLAEIYSGKIPGEPLTVHQLIEYIDSKEGEVKVWKV